jgi:hypothetical protein
MKKNKKIEMKKVLANWLAEYLSGNAIGWLDIFNGVTGGGDDVIVYQFLDFELDEDANFDRLLFELKRVKGR